MELSAQNRSTEENDDLKNRYEPFEEVAKDLADRVEQALNQSEQQLQAIDRLRRQAAALRAAKSSVERQQANLKEREQDLKAEWQKACGETQELAQARHANVAKEMANLWAMDMDILRNVGQGLADRQVGDGE
ncbi:hypothetical protein AC578_2685 [Pseudocercospora eumusae]|uniref:Uncharacterized protein n=1 Tax=Pseudocercospora eumusae TaxID=321146 RepID=A0A139HFU2_9PEZI|nr:hypothetical protein AC578_2685 [Pseudocercospora eumusae]